MVCGKCTTFARLFSLDIQFILLTVTGSSALQDVSEPCPQAWRESHLETATGKSIIGRRPRIEEESQSGHTGLPRHPPAIHQDEGPGMAGSETPRNTNGGRG